MKKLILSGLFIFGAAFSMHISAQVEMPAGASDKNLDDRNVKGRSLELERIKRDADKKDPSKPGEPLSPDPAAELRFKEIKEDFEKIQITQNDIVAVYNKGKKIDYAKISTDAAEITTSGTRLKTNLFPVIESTTELKKKDKKDKKKEVKAPESAKEPEAPQAAESPLPTEIKDLIVALDNTLAAFVGNQMFTNPQVVDPAENAKAKTSLERLIKLSAALNQEADKMAKNEK